MTNELPVSPEDLATRLRRLMPYFVGGLGVAFMVAGIVVNYIQTRQNETVVGKNLLEVASVAGGESVKLIKTEASGAVEKPGVYEIPYDSRVKDVLIAAGGLVAKADRNYIAKYINLAQRVTDGAKVYFPFVGEAVTGNTNSLSNGSNLSNLININLASTEQLDSLPGIGPVTADKIITGRPYQSISELINRKVVSNSVFQKIKDLISVN